ncbi:MAG: transcription antitermination factor NusB [Chloroflexota bacterium]
MIAVFEDDLATASASLKGRTRARAVAMQALYELDATTHDLKTVVRRRLEGDATPDASATYASHLIQGVFADRTEIDALIHHAAPQWPLDQMSRVDKSILRLAIYEMLREADLSPKVIINEAVELAKRFGHDSSPKFVNGVLGTIERDQRERHKTR